MRKIALAIHAGAGSLDDFVNDNIKEHEHGLKDALLSSYALLEQGRSSEEVVVYAVKLLEDNPLFNAGKGSALNANGEVEMDAAIMDGSNLKAGACSVVKNVKNPITLAQAIMQKTKHVFLSCEGAEDFAKSVGLELEDNAYFVTEHQMYELKQFLARNAQKNHKKSVKNMHGTVGAVALDKDGNICAGTSTGGIHGSLPARVGDSCIIGAGCYADNNTCAISATGLGEYIIRGVVGHTISMCIEHGMELAEACEYVLMQRNKKIYKEIGVIAINTNAQIAVSYNTEIMKRAYISSDIDAQIKIY